MRLAAFILAIAGAHSAAAQDEARIKKRVDRELSESLARTRKSLQEFVLKELASAGIGEKSLSAQIDRFAKSLIEDDLHNRLRRLLLSKDGKDLVEQFMIEQNMEDLGAVLDAYFEKEKNGKYRIREEFEEVLGQLLDGAAPPAPAAGTIGIDLVIDKSRPDQVGLKVAGVTAGGPAAAAGLKAGDVVISVGGRDLTSANVEEVMKSLKPGQDVKIAYERDKVKTTATVKAK
jgi:C-terminal processing protease CtpA/Prc